jgi:hypothetical protein
MKPYGQIAKRIGYASGSKSSKKKSNKTARQHLKKENK